MAKKMVEIKELSDFVDWFEANHETKDRVEFKIYKKHTGYPVPSHNEQVRTAICYGWIDTTVKRIDEDSFMRVFVKRKDTASWSVNTLRYAAELTKQGKMKPLGTRHYLRALEKKKIVTPRKSSKSSSGSKKT
uniref:Uncharacterized protein n=1 Tax=Amphimedon queenslandica TaxID=400682 RepID=A0A1X7VV96_AMPQE